MKEKKILIVDDDANLRDIYHRMLKKLGYSNILQASSGDDAVLTALEQSPDLIIMDKNMPGKNGITAAREIMHSLPTSRIIMSTGIGTEQEALDCINIGVTNFMIKPVEIEHLNAVVKRVLRD